MLIEPSEVRPPWVVLDARAGPGAQQAYAQAHVAGAFHADLERDLSEIGDDPSQGGRHPLPSLKRWCQSLGRWGITPSTPVAIYDAAGGGLAAARAWWMLRAVGHERVAIVNGGWDALVESGAKIDARVPREAERPRAYETQVNEWPSVSANVVESIREDPAWLLIDARAPERFSGESEPIDRVAGSIPGAVNRHWQTQLDEAARFLPIDQLARRLGASVPGDHIVCYCGSGVTACHVLFTLELAGIRGASLYVGSWSEWSEQGRVGS